MAVIALAKHRQQSVTPEVTALVKGMVRRGDESQDIAIFFGFNIGRVADIKAGRIHPKAPAAAQEDLPPPGPYLTPHEIWSGAWHARVAVEELETTLLPRLLLILRQAEHSIRKREPRR